MLALKHKLLWRHSFLSLSHQAVENIENQDENLPPKQLKNPTKFKIAKKPGSKVAKKKKSPKKFSCEQCGKIVSKASVLQYHVNTAHENLKTHKCSQCDYACSTKGNLKKHVQTQHEGQKLYVCNICQKTFSEKGNMSQHIARKHDNITHKCDYCDKELGSKSNLKKHMKNVHNVD